MHGLAVQPDQRGDGALAYALLMQGLHFLVAVVASGLPRLLLRLCGGKWFGGGILFNWERRHGRILGDFLLVNVLQALVFALKQAGHGRCHIQQ